MRMTLLAALLTVGCSGVRPDSATQATTQPHLLSLALSAPMQLAIDYDDPASTDGHVAFDRAHGVVAYWIQQPGNGIAVLLETPVDGGDLGALPDREHAPTGVTWIGHDAVCPKAVGWATRTDDVIDFGSACDGQEIRGTLTGSLVVQSAPTAL